MKYVTVIDTYGPCERDQAEVVIMGVGYACRIKQVVGPICTAPCPPDSLHGDTSGNGQDEERTLI